MPMLHLWHTIGTSVKAISGSCLMPPSRFLPMASDMILKYVLVTYYFTFDHLNMSHLGVLHIPGIFKSLLTL